MTQEEMGLVDDPSTAAAAPTKGLTQEQMGLRDPGAPAPGEAVAPEAHADLVGNPDYQKGQAVAKNLRGTGDAVASAFVHHGPAGNLLDHAAAAVKGGIGYMQGQGFSQPDNSFLNYSKGYTD